METIIITPPHAVADETVICNLLFAKGLEVLHLRKPGAGREVYEAFLRGIEPRYRNRIVVHGHYDLAERYGLRGVHLRGGMAEEYARHAGRRVSISCHSVEEVEELPFQPEYCFLSPVFDSISKEGYAAGFGGVPDVRGARCRVIALGGITPERVAACRIAGFAGVAALGYVWEHPEEAVARYIRLRTPEVLSIAGFDPSSGAGVTADLKTLEATGAYGLGVCTAVTFQNESHYAGTRWMTAGEVVRQCRVLLERHRPAIVKVGIIEHPDTLRQAVQTVLDTVPDARIIWDPVVRATAGHPFYAWGTAQLEGLLPHLYLITPNAEEAEVLFGKDAGTERLQEITQKYGVNILRKGGHDTGELSVDCLVTPEEVMYFLVRRGGYGKHGTGCVLSAAVASYLAQGAGLPEACRRAQAYVSRMMAGNDGRLGYHTLQEVAYPPLPSPMELPVQYITAPKEGMSPAEQAEAVCRGGIRWVQLRMKGADDAEMLVTGRKVREVCRRFGSLFVVNDRVEVARQLDADGVHLGKEDMPPVEARRILGKGKIIGATCNTWEDIVQRHAEGVDYIGLGPYTFTTTKEKLSPVLGMEGYRTLMQRMREAGIHLPVFAIGGITEADLPALMRTGVQGIALSGAIKNSPDPTAKTREIMHLLSHLALQTF